MAALSLSLTLPDICGLAKYRSKDVGERYKNWYREYVEPKEKPTSKYGCDMPYLSAEIVYSLRCSMLHQGIPNVENSKIKDERCKVDKFELIINDDSGVDGGLTMVAYGAKMKIVRREQSVSIQHLCSILCIAAKEYYDENQEKFNFFNYYLTDNRKGEF